MKKIFNNKLFIFIMTAVIFSGLGVYAGTNYFAKDIVYNEETNINVEEALNELYNKKPKYTLVEETNSYFGTNFSGSGGVTKPTTNLVPVFYDENIIQLDSYTRTIKKGGKYKFYVTATRAGSWSSTFTLFVNGKSVTSKSLTGYGYMTYSSSLVNFDIDLNEGDTFYFQIYPTESGNDAGNFRSSVIYLS